jgi:hypothetical protein
MSRVLALVWSGLWSLLTLLLGWGWYAYYWRHRHCFNEMGICFVDPVVLHQQTAEVMLILFVPCLAFTLLGLWVASRSGDFRKRP